MAAGKPVALWLRAVACGDERARPASFAECHRVYQPLQRRSPNRCDALSLRRAGRARAREYRTKSAESGVSSPMVQREFQSGALGNNFSTGPGKNGRMGRPKQQVSPSEFETGTRV